MRRLNSAKQSNFLAYKDNQIVGRVAAIINHKANQTWDKKECPLRLDRFHR